jgi:hypothetical protein
MENLFKKGNRSLFALLFLLINLHGYSQNYYAIQGSNYAGNLGIGNNPASIVNTPWKWDLTILGVQAKNATNGLTIHNYSLLSNPANSQYSIKEGDYRRFAYADYNINLLNTRFAINRRQAFGVGVNLRGYAQLSSGPINFIDTLKTTGDFFDLGNYNRKLYGDLVHGSWIEVFATWAQTIWDRTDSRLNAGITAKISRGISGAYTQLLNGTVVQTAHGNDPDYTMQDALARYAYSSNYDNWKDEKNTSTNLRDFISDSRGGFSFDMGVEYIIKPGQIPSVFDDDDYYDYNWKIGLSVLDIGFNQFKYGQQSRVLSGFQNNITDTVLDVQFTDIGNLQEFNNELTGIVRNIQQPGGLFRVINPARAVLNVDHFITGAWYVNGNVSVNLSSLSSNQWRLTELNMLTVTPRWETRRFGFYMPVHFNTREQFWVGGAFKAGPLLLGVHNWANIFSKNKMQNGGAYLALVIRPGKGKSTSVRTDKRLDCPTVSTKFSKNRLGQKVSCPPR